MPNVYGEIVWTLTRNLKLFTLSVGTFKSRFFIVNVQNAPKRPLTIGIEKTLNSVIYELCSHIMKL